MSLSSEYKRQYAWRAWSRIFDALPPLHGQTIIDLGCGVGDQSAELVARGARVIGIDLNEQLLGEAQSRQLPHAAFRQGDLRTLPELGLEADGLWCSFTAAYFPDLPPVLSSWKSLLRPGGWVAFTEVDDLFGHEPLAAQARTLLEGYARDALLASRYDFHMGRKLQGYLEQAGFTVSRVLTLQDQELSFDGPALPEVVDAWRTRFERMTLLRHFCSAHFEPVRDAFLGCLTHANHRSSTKVYCCIAGQHDRKHTHR